MADTLVIGLTGSTGAGKSEVSRRFAECGYTIIDADVLARRAVEPHTDALAQLVNRFSDAILQKDGSLDRAALAAVAFATPEATAAMNAIVHPAVIALLHRDLEAAKQRDVAVVVLDVPLLFQTGLESLCDHTVAVTAPPAVRLARICARDGITEEQGAARMRAQPMDKYYAERATYVIENNGSVEQLHAAVDDVCRRIGR